MIHSRLRLVLSAAHRPDGYGIRTEDVKSPPTRTFQRHTPPVSGPVGWLMRPQPPANPSRTAPYTTGTAQGGGGRRRRPGVFRAVAGNPAVARDGRCRWRGGMRSRYSVYK